MNIRQIAFIIVFIFVFIPSICFADDNQYDFNDIFENHGLVRLIIDTETGSIEYVNNAAIEFYGYSRNQLLKMTIQDINTLSAEQVKAEREAAYREERNYFIFEHQLANGEIRTVEVYSYPIEHQNKKLLFSIILDITEEVLVKNKLEQSQLRITVLTWSVLILLIFFIALISHKKEKYKKKAFLDPLTGAYSRLYLDILIEKCKTDRRKQMDTCTIVVVDLDKFKIINDLYGHHVGDEVLKKVVEVLKMMTRDEDSVIRQGGDEFLVLLKDCTEKIATSILKRVSMKLSDPENFGFPIELSYGIQEFDHSVDLYEAIKSADDKMYKSKSTKS